MVFAGLPEARPLSTVVRRIARSIGNLPGPCGVGLAVIASVGLAGAATALDSDDRRLGLTLANEGRCAPALEVLARVQTEPPSDAEVARLDGLCAFRLGDHRRAIDSLETARALDPSAPDVDLLLGMACYHGGRIEQAAEALERARAREPGRGEVLLYSGLVAYARQDYTAAVGRLDAASRLSDAPVEPMASYFLGRAELGADALDRARTAFERVVRDHPDTPWAEQAARALDEIESGAGAPWWVTAELGIEFDDNALIRGRSVSLPSDISDQTDQRFFWFADAGMTLLEAGGFTGGGTLRYAGSKLVDLERFDAQAGGATLWVDRDLGVADVSLRLQYDFDLVFIDYERRPFVMSHLVGASFYKPWSGGMFTLVGAAVGVDDYGYKRFDVIDETAGAPGTPCSPPATVCAPPLDERRKTDRDGTGVSVSLLQHVPIPLEVPGIGAPWLQGEYRFHRYRSAGSEFDHQRHQVELGFGARLPFAVDLRVRGRYAYSPYENPSVFPDPSDVVDATGSPIGEVYFLDTRNRREHETGVRVSLERAIGERVVLTARYSRTRNRSNADVYDYARDLFGLSVRVGLGGS